MAMVFDVVAVLLCAFITVARGKYRVYALLVGILFFPKTISLHLSGSPSISIVCILLLIGLCFVRPMETLRELIHLPFVEVSVFVYLLLLMVGICDARLSWVERVMRPTVYYLAFSAPLLLAGVFLRSKQECLHVLRFYVILMLVFCVYGIVCFVTRSNMYYSFISALYDVRDVGAEVLAKERSRVSSFATYPHLYGIWLVLSILAVCLLRAMYEIRTAWPLVIAFLLLVGNLLLTNCRVVILVMAVGWSVWLLAGGGYSRNRLLAALLALCVGIAAIFSGHLGVVTDTIDTVRGKSEATGSTLESRVAMFKWCYIEFLRSPWVGNGFGYKTEVLGYAAKKEERASEKEFAGFESLWATLLVEQGMCGIAAMLVLFGALACYWIRWLRAAGRSQLRLVAVFAIAMLVAYFSFVTLNSALGSFTVFFTLMGVCVRYVSLEYPSGCIAGMTRQSRCALSVCHPRGLHVSADHQSRAVSSEPR